MPRVSTDRYSEFAFAKGWGSVSTICGQLEKGFLPPWYAKLVWEEAKELTEYCIKNKRPIEELYLNLCEGKPSKPYRVVRDSQDIGKLIDTEIQHHFGDADIKEVSRGIIEKEGEAKEYYYQSIRNFHKWTEHYKPKSVFAQKVVYSKYFQYIGTFDRLLVIDKKLVLVDWKATNSVSYEYKMQLEAYFRALTEMVKDGIINLGEATEWHETPLWIVQLPKKEEMDLEKNVIKFAPSDLRFKNFVNLLSFYYGKKEDEAKEEKKSARKSTKRKKV